MRAIIGRKLGMMSLFREDGSNVPVTVIEAGPCHVTQVKTEENDGYYAVQLGFGERSDKNTTRPMMGHLKKAGVDPVQVMKEFPGYEIKANPGDTITVDIFREGEFVHVVGKSKGKGFQGVVKRHGFSGVGGRTHGQHNRGRAPGSLGAGSYPARVFKGMRMAGRMGNDRVMIENLTVEKIITDKNLILVRGAVPGHKGSIVFIEAEGQ